jgi:hypothetical protein
LRAAAASQNNTRNSLELLQYLVRNFHFRLAVASLVVITLNIDIHSRAMSDGSDVEILMLLAIAKLNELVCD